MDLLYVGSCESISTTIWYLFIIIYIAVGSGVDAITAKALESLREKIRCPSKIGWDCGHTLLIPAKIPPPLQSTNARQSDGEA